MYYHIYINLLTNLYINSYGMLKFTAKRTLMGVFEFGKTSSIKYDRLIVMSRAVSDSCELMHFINGASSSGWYNGYRINNE